MENNCRYHTSLKNIGIHSHQYFALLDFHENKGCSFTDKKSVMNTEEN